MRFQGGASHADGSFKSCEAVRKYANLYDDNCHAHFGQQAHSYAGPRGPFKTSVANASNMCGALRATRALQDVVFEAVGRPLCVFGGHQDAPGAQHTCAPCRAVVWDARTHRRNKRQPRPCAYRGGHPEKRARDTMWYVSAVSGPLVLGGGCLLIFGMICKLQVGYFNTRFGMGWSETKADWLVLIPFLVRRRPHLAQRCPCATTLRGKAPITAAAVQVGSVLLAVAAYCAVVEAVNVDYRSNLRKWRAVPKGLKPRVQWDPLPYHVKHAFVSYYGAYVTYIGALLFVLGNAADLIKAHKGFSANLTTALIDAPFLAGGVCFVVGGYLLTAEARHSWLRALAPPLGRNATNLGQWTEYVHLCASVLLLVGGGLIFGPLHDSQRAYRLCNGLSFFPAFLLLALQGAFMVYESFDLEW